MFKRAYEVTFEDKGTRGRVARYVDEIPCSFGYGFTLRLEEFNGDQPPRKLRVTVEEVE